MDQKIEFGRSVLSEMIPLLNMIHKDSIVTESPIKLSWGSIAWEKEKVSISIKENSKNPLPKVRKKRSANSCGDLPGLT